MYYKCSDIPLQKLTGSQTGQCIFYTTVSLLRNVASYRAIAVRYFMTPAMMRYYVWEGYGYYMKIQESAENYLETILVLKKKNGVVRSIDIANDLGVSKPSVSVAMKNLRNGEYIEMDKEGYITLLDKGREIAEKIYERHTFLTDWLTSIGVDPTVAAEDACRIEHVISAETFTAMKKTLKTK